MELAALAPDVMVATGGTSAGPLLQASKTVPIVFANVPDPVGSGFIESLSRPGGNATGFVQFEYNLSGKWLELLKQIAPDVRSVAVLWDPAIIAGVGQFAVIQSVAPALGVEVRAINVRDAVEIERLVAAFANVTNGGMIVTASALAFVHRDERSGDLGYAVLRVHRCQMTSGAIDVSSKFKKEVRTMHRDDVGRPCNIFQFGVERLHLSGIGL